MRRLKVLEATLSRNDQTGEGTRTGGDRRIIKSHSKIGGVAGDYTSEANRARATESVREFYAKDGDNGHYRDGPCS
jgi:hypothetical protein